MATGQTLLNLIEILAPELQLQSGENDVTKGLIALNAAQDYMESVFALQPDLMGDGTGTVVTSNGVEKTGFPQGLLRLDKMYKLDDGTGLPVNLLDDIKETGGHINRTPYSPFYTSGTTASGLPRAYWTDGTSFYWQPTPDASYTVRWYGFQAKPDITASGTIQYPDVCQLPLAVMAAKIIRTGLDDDVSQYQKMASETFEPVVALMSNFQRERAPGFQYRYQHLT